MNGFVRIHVRVLKPARDYHVTDRVFINFENGFLLTSQPLARALGIRSAHTKADRLAYHRTVRARAEDIHSAKVFIRRKVL